MTVIVLVEAAHDTECYHCGDPIDAEDDCYYQPPAPGQAEGAHYCQDCGFEIDHGLHYVDIEG